MDKNILGCFVSSGSSYSSDNQEIIDLANKKGEIFRQYIYGNGKLVETIKELNHQDYGQDLVLILFKFYVNPIPYMLQNLKEIEPYRTKEKAIGIPIIINDENFFNKSEEDRFSFLKQSILKKLELLSEVIKKKKLDTKIDLLKANLYKLLN